MTGEKDNRGAIQIGPGTRIGDGGDADANVDSDVGGCGRETGVEGAGGKLNVDYEYCIGPLVIRHYYGGCRGW